MKALTIASIAAIFLMGCASTKNNMNTLRENILKEYAATPKITYALAFKDIQTGETLFINEKQSFHAASTMKTPVLAELYRQAEAGKFSLQDFIPVVNEFKSIVDGSPYSMQIGDDSEPQLYKQVGGRQTYYNLAWQMITYSSNLATNILIDRLGADNVMQLMKSSGANDIRVLRGVEDNKAYERGLNNTTTAYDLMLIFEKIARREMVSPAASDGMLNILMDQHFKSIIPAQLPKTVKVAHKTGSISTVNHDSGIVILPDGRRYVIVLLSRFEPGNSKAAIATMARVSRMVYDAVE